MKKIAIVTGGSSGIGKAAALMLCETAIPCTSSAAEARITAASST